MTFLCVLDIPNNIPMGRTLFFTLRSQRYVVKNSSANFAMSVILPQFVINMQPLNRCWCSKVVLKFVSDHISGHLAWICLWLCWSLIACINGGNKNRRFKLYYCYSVAACFGFCGKSSSVKLKKYMKTLFVYNSLELYFFVGSWYTNFTGNNCYISRNWFLKCIVKHLR